LRFHIAVYAEAPTEDAELAEGKKAEFDQPANDS
jgi:hypothetical protein